MEQQDRDRVWEEVKDIKEQIKKQALEVKELEEKVDKAVAQNALPHQIASYKEILKNRVDRQMLLEDRLSALVTQLARFPQVESGKLAADIEERRALWREVKELRIENNKYSQTSQTDQAVGELYQERMAHMADFPFLAPVSEKDRRTEDACRAVLKAFSRDPTGVGAGVGAVYVKRKSRGGKRSPSDEDREDAQQQAEGEAEGEAGDEDRKSVV